MTIRCLGRSLKITRLAVDNVKPWLTHIVCPLYHNDPIYNKDLGLLLKTRGYWGLHLSLEHDTSFRYSATTDQEELPYVLDLAVHLVHLDR